MKEGRQTMSNESSEGRITADDEARVEEYRRGRTARRDGRPYDPDASVDWRGGWLLMDGRIAHSDGIPYDPEKSWPWRVGWENQDGLASYRAGVPYDPDWSQSRRNGWKDGDNEKHGAKRFEAGLRAFFAGRPYDENAHSYWQMGWKEGQADPEWFRCRCPDGPVVAGGNG